MHAPEPWKLTHGGQGIAAADGRPIFAFIAGWDEEHTAQVKGDLRRIVACINACAGTETEELEAQGDDDAHGEDDQGQ